MEQFLNQFEVLRKKGMVDYNAAKILYHSYSEGNIELKIEVIAFHLQQCAEKLIKALLSYKDIDFSVEGRYAVIHDDIENVDIFILKQFKI